MKKYGIPGLIVGFVLFVAGLVLLEHSSAGILVLIAGIGTMIFGSVLLMAVSGKQRVSYFHNGRHYHTTQASEKVTVQARTENIWDQVEQKQN